MIFGLPLRESTMQRSGVRLPLVYFASIAAHAAEEKRQQGKSDVTPYWRTLKAGGLINEKYPGGFDLQKLLLESEGHMIIQRNKKFYVKDYLKALASLDQ
jgi:alkylated DNA nucleotide flippase Atl1